jgi:Rod binding domain-containing protein
MKGPMSTIPSTFPLSSSASLLNRLPAAGYDQASRQREFSAILSRRVEGPGGIELSPEDEAKEAARQLVSIALVQPLLAQLRETSQAAPPFAPTSAERQFRAMADAQLAQGIVKAGNFPLVDVLAQRMLAKTRVGATSAPPTPPLGETDMEVRR